MFLTLNIYLMESKLPACLFSPMWPYSFALRPVSVVSRVGSFIFLSRRKRRHREARSTRARAKVGETQTADGDHQVEDEFVSSCVVVNRPNMSSGEGETMRQLRLPRGACINKCRPLWR